MAFDSFTKSIAFFGITKAHNLHKDMDSDLVAAMALLDQAGELIEKISSSAWTKPNATFRNSTIGQHMRHTLDHYESLLSHTKYCVVDYDTRNRDQNIESSPSFTKARCHELLDRLKRLGETFPADQPFHVKTSCSVESEITTRSSSFGRELQFLVSHTIHHYAIIGAICHGLDIELPPTFGIAPSTLKHREAMANG